MIRLSFFTILYITTGRVLPVTSLAFGPQLQFSNLFSALTNNISDGKSKFRYTHLEGNGQLWEATNGNTKISVVVDPIASQLDFGIPWGYRANKKVLSEDATIDMICDAEPSHCLLTMGLDDHTHLPTLEKLSNRIPTLNYIVAPSCKQKLLDFGLRSDQIKVLDHGDSCILSDGATVTATQGALVGPPWQKRENGFLLELESDNKENSLSIYYEPHGDVILDNIKGIRADVMVSPVTKQSLPAQLPPAGQFTLVYGGERTLEIAELLGAKVVVPLGNGALDIEGPLSGLVVASGDVSDFEKLIKKRNVCRDDAIKVAKASAGVPLTITI